jgi:16S rRNA (cytosine1402-N4)-methyltransferase
MTEYLPHYSVMLDECLNFLREGVEHSGSKLLADLTFGAGGHTIAIAQQIETSRVYSTDQDPDALKNGEAKIAGLGLGDKITLLPMNFVQFPAWGEANGLKHSLAGILMDLGVSSHQFDKMDRGFSFRADAALDMRMNYGDDKLPTAADLLNNLSESEIADLLFNYGEERLSRKIAARICERRVKDPITTTGELEEICFLAYPPKDRHGRTHPATRTFQALRIAVNDELRVLEKTLPQLLPLLAPGGVIAVISFHSLEDRIVKHTFKSITENDQTPARILTKKPVTAGEAELLANSRSRSAKLRVLQTLSSHEERSSKKGPGYFK